MQHFLDCETNALTPYSWCRAKLVFNPVLFDDVEQPRAQDRTKYFRTEVHKCDPAPLVGISEVATFCYRYHLSFMPFVKVGFLVPERIEEIEKER